MKRILLWAALCLALWPVAARAEWRRATSYHFTVYSEGSEKSLRDFTTRLERFDALVRHATKFREREEKPRRLTVYLVSGTNVVQRLMGKGWSSVAGFYVARPAGALAVVPRSNGSGEYDLDAETVLYHEYAHHFLLQNFPFAYPAWYVEGFAEFYSTAETTDTGAASVGKPAKHRFYGLVLLSTMPVARMFQAHKMKMGSDEMENFYGRSWLLTHYLTFAPERKGQLDAYIRAINSGVEADKAAIDSFGPLAALDRDLKAYQNRRKLTYLQVSGMDPKPPEIRVESLAAAEGALLMADFAWTRGISSDRLEAYAADVRAIAARFGDAPAASNALANAAILKGEWDKAEVANEAFLAQRPADPRALLRRAEIAMARLEAKKSSDAGEWKKARQLIVKANRADVDDPLPLIAYYASFRREGVKPTTLATDGLIRAMQLTPQSEEVRLAAAAQLIEDGKPDQARSALEPLAYAPHKGGGREVALQMLATLGAAETAPALKTPG